MESNSQLAQIEETAAAWLLKSEHAADWSPADAQQLEAWLSASPSHQVAFIRVRAVWSRAGRLKTVAAAFGDGVPARGDIRQLPFFELARAEGHGTAAPVPQPELVKHSGASGRVRFAIAAAAAIVLASVGLASWWLTREKAFETPIGGLTTVPIQDGSRVTLNTDTRVSVGLTDEQRHITLARGEAFFDVAKDPQRPFVVGAKDKRVVAVGTRFGVRIDGDEVRVTVTAGRVRVEDGDEHAGRTLAYLSAGESALLPAAVRKAIPVEQEPLEVAERRMSWRTGFVVFQSTPLREAVAELNRYNAQQLVIADESIEDLQVGGQFQPNNLDGFVRLLQEGFPVRAQRFGNETVLTGRAPKR